MREQIAQQPPQQRQRTVTYQPDLDELEDQIFSTRSNTSVRRYQPMQPTQTRVRVRHTTQVPPRATAHIESKRRAPERQEQSQPRPALTRRQFLSWKLLGVGTVAATIAGVITVDMVGAWWQGVQDDAHYGRPRTFQCDAVVGHADSVARPSHFIVLNLNRQVQVLEFPGGDSSKVKIYMVVMLPEGQELAPVTLAFRDVNQDGKPDMLVTIDNIRFVFINENGTFRPLHGGEHVNV